MCLILSAYKKHKDFKFILAGNRDEFYKRDAEKIHFWEGEKKILGGRDNLGNGTWLGINKEGKLGAITNIRNPALLRSDAPSRGALITDFLENSESSVQYLERIKKESSKYNGFNLLLLDKSDLIFFSNQNKSIDLLNPGIYGICNDTLDTPWPKLVKSKNEFSDLINSNKEIEFDEILSILEDNEKPPEESLPDTGVGSEWEKILSSVFIKSELYGTRVTSLILLDYENRVTFYEKTHGIVGEFETEEMIIKKEFKIL